VSWPLPDDPVVIFGLPAADDELRQRVDDVVVGAHGEHAALVEKVIDPCALGHQPTMRARVRQPHIARFDGRRRGLGARALPPSGFMPMIPGTWRLSASIIAGPFAASSIKIARITGRIELVRRVIHDCVRRVVRTAFPMYNGSVGIRSAPGTRTGPTSTPAGRSRMTPSLSRSTNTVRSEAFCACLSSRVRSVTNS
jgi:hypothetical protein